MQYHSTDYSVSAQEFARMFGVAANGSAQLLLVSPGPIGNLETQFSRAFGPETWKRLFRDRQIAVGSLTVFLEARGNPSEFSMGNVFLPYAGMRTVAAYVGDNRSANTFFLSQSGPTTGWDQDDLSLYLKSYPGSIAV